MYGLVCVCICASYGVMYLKKQYLKSAVKKHRRLTHQTWHNPLLTWNASEFGDIKTINVDPKKVWKPDLYLYNK